MRADAAEAERHYEVREAARGWRGVGAIDEAARTKIDAAYPDDRARLGPVFRVLVFGFTVVAVTAFFGLFGLAVAAAGQGAAKVVILLFGCGLVGAAEFQLGTLRRRQGGTESATAFLGVCYLFGGMLWLVGEARAGEDAFVDVALILAMLLLGATGYRWGYTLFALGATAAAYVLLARGSYGRAAWIVVPLVVAPLLFRAADSVRLPPAHRRSCEAMAALSLVFLYVAVHVGSWDLGVVEIIRGNWHGVRAAGSLRPFAIAATALVPVATLVWGIAARRRLLINLAFLGVLASIVTLRVYVHVAPLWVALLAGGAIAIGVALAVRRYLDSGSGHERFGFTAEPLFGDPESRSALEVAASVASLGPAPKAAARPGFEGQGGQFGGGGATGDF